MRANIWNGAKKQGSNLEYQFRPWILPPLSRRNGNKMLVRNLLSGPFFTYLISRSQQGREKEIPITAKLHQVACSCKNPYAKMASSSSLYIKIFLFKLFFKISKRIIWSQRVLKWIKWLYKGIKWIKNGSKMIQIFLLKLLQLFKSDLASFIQQKMESR